MNAGRVELDLVAIGKDQVSAMLRQVEAQAKQTAASMKTLGDRAGVASAPLKKFESGAEMAAKKLGNMQAALVGGLIGSLTGGLIGAIVEMGAALVDAVADLFSAEQGLDSFSESAIAGANDAAQLSAQITNIGISANNASEQVKGFEQRVANAAAAIARMRGQGDLAKEFEKAAQVAATGDAIKAIEENMVAAETAANNARKTVLELRPKVEQARRDADSLQRTIEYRESLGLGTSEQRLQLGLTTASLSLLTAEVTRSEEAYKDLTIAVEKMATEAANLDSLQVEQGKTQAKVTADAIARTPRGGGRAPGAPVTLADTYEMFVSSEGGPDAVLDTIKPMTIEITRVATETERAAAAFEKLAAGTVALDSVLPGLSSTFSQIAEIWKGTKDNAKSLASGVIGSVDAIATAGAAWFKDEKDRTRFLGAKELLLAAPMYFYDPVQAAVKTATGLGLLALAGGGGGGGARGGGAASGRVGAMSSGGGGPTTVINNFSMGIGDRQTITQAVRQSQRSSVGTGADARAAV